MQSQLRRLTRTALAAAMALALVGPARAASVPDAWITTKVKISLLTGEGMSSRHVDVDTVNGLVTLHGAVSSAAERDKAAELARGVSGVRNVRNLLQVVPSKAREVTQVADDRLKDQVAETLKADPALADSRIAVQSVTAGVVLLSGEARSLSDAYRAIYDASAVDGVRRVASEIKSPDTIQDTEVWRDGDYDPEAYGHSSARDAWITTAAKMRLFANPETPAFDINVDTRDRVVTLFGIVDSMEAKQQAEFEARKVGGVRNVVNDLQVVAKNEKKAVERDDGQLTKSIEERFRDRGTLGEVHVEVRDGVARLTGTVKTRRDQVVALSIARTTAGVRRVIDDLQLAAPTVSSR